MYENLLGRGNSFYLIFGFVNKQLSVMISDLLSVAWYSLATAGKNDFQIEGESLIKLSGTSDK